MDSLLETGNHMEILVKNHNFLLVSKCIAFLDDLNKKLAETKLIDSKIMVPEVLSVSEGTVYYMYYVHVVATDIVT